MKHLFNAYGIMLYTIICEILRQFTFLNYYFIIIILVFCVIFGCNLRHFRDLTLFLYSNYQNVRQIF